MTYDIKCAQIRELVDNGGQLIDVRSNHEFTQGALKNAVNVPVESVPYCANTIDRNKPVMLCCVSGTRANLAKHFLESLGFNNVYNLGGMSQLAHC